MEHDRVHRIFRPDVVRRTKSGRKAPGWVREINFGAGLHDCRESLVALAERARGLVSWDGISCTEVVSWARRRRSRSGLRVGLE